MNHRHPRHYKRALIFSLALAVAMSMGSFSFAANGGGLIHQTSEDSIRTALHMVSPGLHTFAAKPLQIFSADIDENAVPLAEPEGELKETGENAPAAEQTEGETVTEDSVTDDEPKAGTADTEESTEAADPAEDAAAFEEPNAGDDVEIPAADFDVTGEHILFVPYRDGAAVMMAEKEADGSLNAKLYNVQEKGEEATIDTSDRDRDATEWEFERISEEKSIYYVFVTKDNGDRRYLNIDHQKVLLSETPQEIIVEQDEEGNLKLSNMEGMTIELRAGEIANGFTATNQASSTSGLSLGTTREVTVTYTYTQAAGDAGEAEDVAKTIKVDTTDLEYTIQETEMESYVSTDGSYAYTYSFEHWYASNGNKYNPGDKVDLTAFEDKPLVLLAQWKLTDKEEAANTAKNFSFEGCDFSVEGSGNASFENGILTVSGNMTVSMAEGKEETTQRIVVAQDDNNNKSTIKLNGVDIKAKDSAPGIYISPDVKATLVLAKDSVNSVVGGPGYAGVGVAWTEDLDYKEIPTKGCVGLTIKGEGTLNATGGSGFGGAGIGGSYYAKGVYGHIVIESGSINATGSGRGAGIGSSDNPADGTSHGSYKFIDENDQPWGMIIIDGGSIAAKGVGNGAGIGGGNHTSSGKIIINGGTIDASGDTGIGAGLGSSSGANKGPGYYFADVTINGGNITAYATNNMGAGIGGGMYSDAYVTINGGTVTASVTTKGNAYQGGAGIGGGYQGCGVVKITGGTITATGGNGSPGIGDGAGAATTSTKNENGDAWKDTKNIRTGKPTIAAGESLVEITGGNVSAYGGLYGAGIGSGNFSQWANVKISGGTVYAEGSLSSEKELLGAAGIGSGTTYVPSKAAYMVKTDVNVTITGGTITAIGGWGASGIGSGTDGVRNEDGTLKKPLGAQNMANQITIDGEKADVQAYADGTKFAIDTRLLDDETGKTTSRTEGRDITGNVLQGTFVHNYEDSDISQSPEGLKSIVLTNDATGASRTLTLMPAGYRSYAASVDGSGTYTVYTDDASIGKGEGRYFSTQSTDIFHHEEAVSPDNLIQYTVTGNALSDNFYLFPVKCIAVKKVVKADPEGSSLSDLNTKVYFALFDKQGQKFLEKGDNVWTQTIEIKAGKPQGRAYFINVNDGTYDVVEIDKKYTAAEMQEKLQGEGDTINQYAASPKSMDFGTEEVAYKLVSIKTTHAGGTDNNGEISDEQWTDEVTVINTYQTPNTKTEEPTSESGSDPDPTDNTTVDPTKASTDPTTEEPTTEKEKPSNPENIPQSDDAGSLTIVKILGKDSENVKIPADTTFTIEGPEGFNDDQPLEIKYGDFNSGSYILEAGEDLPAGEYTVTENTDSAAVEYYNLIDTKYTVDGDTSAKRATVTVGEEGPAQVQIENTYEVDNATITIAKTIRSYLDLSDTSNATAVFEMTVYRTDRQPLTSYHAFTFTKAGTQRETIELENPQTLQKVEITEVYGAGYQTKGSTSRTVDLTKGHDRHVTVNFENEYDGSKVTEGTGIINTYKNRSYKGRSILSIFGF